MTVNYKDARPNSIPKTIRFEKKLLALVDDARGDTPFATYLHIALREKLGIDKKAPASKTKKAKPKAKTNKSPSLNMPKNVTEKIYDAIKLLKSDGKSARMIAKEIDISRGSVDRALKFDNYPK